MPRYIATARGYAGRLIEAGDEFTYDGPKGSWMEEVKEEVSDAPAKAAPRSKAKEESKGSASNQDVI